MLARVISSKRCGNLWMPVQKIVHKKRGGQVSKHYSRSSPCAYPAAFLIAGKMLYLKSYSTVALAIISNSSLFVVYQRYFRPASGLGPVRGMTLPDRKPDCTFRSPVI